MSGSWVRKYAKKQLLTQNNVTPNQNILQLIQNIEILFHNNVQYESLIFILKTFWHSDNKDIHYRTILKRYNPFPFQISEKHICNTITSSTDLFI